jgi:mannosyl-glycoprotein endo-beta-N-acetylglucosaminidase
MAAVTGHIKRKMFVQKVVGKESSKIATSSVKEFSQQSKGQIQRGLATAEDRDGQKNFARVKRSAAPAANVAMIAYSAATLKIRTTTYEHGINAKHHFGENAGRTHAETMHASIKEVGMKLNKQTQWNEKPFSIVTEIDSVGKVPDRPAPNYDTKGSMGLGYKNDITNSGMNRELGVAADGRIAISKDRQYILDSKGNEFIKIDPSKMQVDKHGAPVVSNGQFYKPNGEIGDKFKVANIKPDEKAKNLMNVFKTQQANKAAETIKSVPTPKQTVTPKNDKSFAVNPKDMGNGAAASYKMYKPDFKGVNPKTNLVKTKTPHTEGNHFVQIKVTNDRIKVRTINQNKVSHANLSKANREIIRQQKLEKHNGKPANPVKTHQSNSSPINKTYEPANPVNKIYELNKNPVNKTYQPNKVTDNKVINQNKVSHTNLSKVNREIIRQQKLEKHNGKPANPVKTHQPNKNPVNKTYQSANNIKSNEAVAFPIVKDSKVKESEKERGKAPVNKKTKRAKKQANRQAREQQKILPRTKDGKFIQLINPKRNLKVRKVNLNKKNRILLERYKTSNAISQSKPHKSHKYHAVRRKDTPRPFDVSFVKKHFNPNENAKSFGNFKTDKVKCVNLNHEAGKVAETAKIYKNSVNAYNKRVTIRNAKLFGQAVRNRFKTGEKIGDFMKNAPTMKLAKKNWRVSHYGRRAKRIEKNSIRLRRQLRRLPKSFIKIFTAPINQTEAGRALNIGTSMGRPVLKAAKVAGRSGSWLVNQEMYKAVINITAQIQARILNAKRAAKGLKPLSHKAQVRMVRQHLYKKYGQSTTGIFRKKAAKAILNRTTGEGLASEFIKGQMEATMRSNGSRKIAKKARKKARKVFIRKHAKNFAKKVYKKVVPKPVQNIVASIKAFFKKMFTNFLKLLNAMLKKLASTIVGKICIAIASAISGIMSFLSAILVPVIVPILIVIATMLMVASLIPNIAEGVSNFISDRKANHTFAQEYDVLHDAHTAFINKISAEMGKYDNSQVVFVDGTDENYVELLSAYNVMTQSESDLYDKDDNSYKVVLKDLYDKTHFIRTDDTETYTYVDADGNTRTGTRVFVEIQRGEYITYAAYQGMGTSITINGDGTTGTVTNAQGACPSVSLGGNSAWINIVAKTKAALAAARAGYANAYDQGGSSTIQTEDGVVHEFRPDCSGFTSLCLELYGKFGRGQKYSSRDFVSAASIDGFTKYSWSGWQNLQQGDIIALNGHVEIFDHNDGNAHYVYNCGSNSSARAPGVTKSGHSAYTVVWRPNVAGSVTNTTPSTGTTENAEDGIIRDDNNNLNVEGALNFTPASSNTSGIIFNEDTGNEDGYDVTLLADVNAEMRNTSLFTNSAYDYSGTMHTLVGDDNDNEASSLDFVRYIYAKHGVQVGASVYNSVSGDNLTVKSMKEADRKNLQIGDIIYYYPHCYKLGLKKAFKSDGALLKEESDYPTSTISHSEQKYLKYFKKKFLKLKKDESISDFKFRKIDFEDLISLYSAQKEFLADDDHRADSNNEYNSASVMQVINSAIPMIYIGNNKVVAYSWDLAEDENMTVEMKTKTRSDGMNGWTGQIKKISGEGKDAAIRTYTLGSDIKSKYILGYYHPTGLTKTAVYGANNMFCGWTDDQILLFNAEINQSYWEDGTIEFIDNDGNEQQTAFYDKWVYDETNHDNFYSSSLAGTIGDAIGDKIVGDMDSVDFTAWASNDRAKAFQTQVWDAAKKTYDERKVPVSVIMAAACVSTNMGATEEASHYNNVFGMTSDFGDIQYSSGIAEITKYTYASGDNPLVANAYKQFGSYANAEAMKYYKFNNVDDCVAGWTEKAANKYGAVTAIDPVSYYMTISSLVHQTSVFTNDSDTDTKAKDLINDSFFKTRDDWMNTRQSLIDACNTAYSDTAKILADSANAETRNGLFSLAGHISLKLQTAKNDKAINDFDTYINDKNRSGGTGTDHDILPGNSIVNQLREYNKTAKEIYEAQKKGKSKDQVGQESYMEAQITSLTNSINSNGATGDGNFSSSNHDALQKSIDAAKAQLKTFSDFVNDDNNKTNGDVVDSSNCIGRLQALIDKAQGAYDTQNNQKDSETVAAEKEAEAQRIANYKINHPYWAGRSGNSDDAPDKVATWNTEGKSYTIITATWKDKKNKTHTYKYVFNNEKKTVEIAEVSAAGTVAAGKSITTNNCAYINAALCNGYKGGIYSRTKDGSLQGPNRKISTIENTNSWSNSMWYSAH